MRDPRLIVRLAAGGIFIGFGAAKFLNHSAEVESFDTYGLPSPDAFVYLIGTIEVIGGALLVLGRGVRSVAVLLAADMIGAISVSGIGRWEAISLTLAPALLVAMVYLARGPAQLRTSGE